MPELPEVQTMVQGLRRKVLNRTIVKIWSDAESLVKNSNFLKFKKRIKNRKIKDIFRQGKVVCFELNDNKILFIHPKMTGHFLIGKWRRAGNQWQLVNKKLLADSASKFIHLIFWLDNGLMLTFSDLRKFARIELWDKTELNKAKIVQELGVDALTLTLTQLEKILKKRQTKIKQTLMEQKLIAGIGNIYADEILFKSQIHPFRLASSLSNQEVKKIHQAIKLILKKAIGLGGSSVSDFYNSEGEPGRFQNELKVYRRHQQSCFHCQTIIQRQKLGSRSTHFCPKCQK